MTESEASDSSFKRVTTLAKEFGPLVGLMVGVCGAFGGAAWGLMKHVDKKIDNLEAMIDKLSDCFASYAERMAD